MRDRFSSPTFRSARPRWPAVVGAVVLWGAAAVVLSLGGAPPWSPWPALAAEADAPLPPAEPLRFFFPKGEARLPLVAGQYAFNQQETVNSQALKRLFDLQARLVGLPVRPVWTTSTRNGMKEQMRLLSTAIVDKATRMGVEVPALPKDGPLFVATGDSDFDVIEYRLEAVKPAPQAECVILREIAFAGMPSAVDGGPLRLTLAKGMAAAAAGTVWRDIPGVGHAGKPGPWRLWTAPSAGKTKEMSDYVRPWDGKLKVGGTTECDVRLVAVGP